MHVSLLDPQSATWPAELDRIYAQLGGAHNPWLLPPHFLQVVLPSIGGQVGLLQVNGQAVGVGFLFPRAQQGIAKGYTVRFHPLVDNITFDRSAIEAQLAKLLGGAPMQFYDPRAPQTFVATQQELGTFAIGRPDQAEAQAIRALQQQVWGSAPGALYPVDIHSQAFGLGTSLVARVAGKTAGFLFGFYKFGKSPLPLDWAERFNGHLRLESQTLGVLPEFRGLRLGFWLKRAQAEQAVAQGIQLINWTVDPLQAPNALLNFGLLRAVAFDFTPDYYPAFRNELNRLPASRFSITWLVSTARVRQGFARNGQATPLDLADRPDIIRVNDGWQRTDYHITASRIAIEIPDHWTALQRDAPDEAAQWRAATDQLLQHYIGRSPGQYVVTDIGAAGPRRFLLAERVEDALWARLGAT